MEERNIYRSTLMSKIQISRKELKFIPFHPHYNLFLAINIFLALIFLAIYIFSNNSFYSYISSILYLSCIKNYKLFVLLDFVSKIFLEKLQVRNRFVVTCLQPKSFICIEANYYAFGLVSRVQSLKLTKVLPFVVYREHLHQCKFDRKP